MVRNKEHKFDVTLLTELGRLMYFQTLKYSMVYTDGGGLKVSCRVLNSNICCLDITSEKQSVDSIVKFISAFLFQPPAKVTPVAWSKIQKMVNFDPSVQPTEWAEPGTKSGLRQDLHFSFFFLRQIPSGHCDPLNAMSTLAH